MKPNHTLAIRMGASEWSVTFKHQGAEQKIDMRKLDTSTRRQVIFKVVEAVRIMRDSREKVAA